MRDLEISEVPRRLGLVGKNIMMPVGYNLKLEAWSDIEFNCKVLRKWLSNCGYASGTWRSSPY